MIRYRSIKRLNENTLELKWNEEINVDILDVILHFERAIHKEFGEIIEESFHTYQALAIQFNPEKITFEEIERRIIKLKIEQTITRQLKTWVLPVCYDRKYGKDLDSYCEMTGISIEELIKIHSKQKYTLYFFGFLPGFMYLGGLDERLHVARKSTPDRSIPAGTVAIGGSQTGIYPTDSPGGWYAIGKCPVPIFDASLSSPCQIESGDQVLFKPVSIEELKKITDQIKKGNYELNPTDHG